MIHLTIYILGLIWITYLYIKYVHDIKEDKGEPSTKNVDAITVGLLWPLILSLIAFAIAAAFIFVLAFLVVGLVNFIVKSSKIENVLGTIFNRITEKNTIPVEITIGEKDESKDD